MDDEDMGFVDFGTDYGDEAAVKAKSVPPISFAHGLRKPSKRAPERVGRGADPVEALDPKRYAATVVPSSSTRRSKLKKLLGAGWNLFDNDHGDGQDGDEASDVGEYSEDDGGDDDQHVFDQETGESDYEDEDGDEDDADGSHEYDSDEEEASSGPAAAAAAASAAGGTSARSIVPSNVRSAADDLEMELLMAPPPTVDQPLLRKRSLADEQQRAVDTKNQRALCDLALEYRILLQRSMDQVARLPTPDAFREFFGRSESAATPAAAPAADPDSGDEEEGGGGLSDGVDGPSVAALVPKLKAAQHATTRSLQSLVREFLALRAELVDQTAAAVSGPGRDALAPPSLTEAVSSSALGDKSTSELDRLWTVVERTHQTLEPWLCEQLDGLSSRAFGLNTATAASGSRRNPNQRKTALRSVRTMNVRETLDRLMRSDAPRLHKRARTIRRPVQRVGQRLVVVAGQQAAPAADDAGQRLSTGRPVIAAGTVDPEIYDDTDLYQQLLKQIVNQQHQQVQQQLPAAANGRQQQWLASKQRDVKTHTRTVDRKASKGRRLRFNVHERLVNFMAPSETTVHHLMAKSADKALECDKDELFSSLFQ